MSRKVNRIREACEVADDAITAVYEHEQTWIGRTTHDIAKVVNGYIIAHSDGLAFNTIVGRSAQDINDIHPVPNYEPIKPGDFIMIDCGAMIGGYCSDITRTFMAGNPHIEDVKLYGLINRAQNLGVSLVSEGTTINIIDSIVRVFLTTVGISQYYTHTIGHGVGKEVHDYPGQFDTLRINDVITIEPGVYSPRRGSIRIEDTVLVTAYGCERLTKFPKEELMVLS